MKKKKILYLVTKANWGGAQKYVFDLASEMMGRDDYEVAVAYGEPFGELNSKLKKAGIQTIKIKGLGRDINFLDEFKVAKSLWKIFREEKPDIILLDIMMPGIEGFEVLEKLKKNKKTLHIPVIMLTAKSEDESKVKAAGLYCHDYIVKPVEFEVLISKIEKALSMI